jgi:hypothetical protein
LPLPLTSQQAGARRRVRAIVSTAGYTGRAPHSIHPPTATTPTPRSSQGAKIPSSPTLSSSLPTHLSTLLSSHLISHLSSPSTSSPSPSPPLPSPAHPTPSQVLTTFVATPRPSYLVPIHYAPFNPGHKSSHIRPYSPPQSSIALTLRSPPSLAPPTQVLCSAPIPSPLWCAATIPQDNRHGVSLRLDRTSTHPL